MDERPSYLEVDLRTATRDRGFLGPLRDDPEWAEHLAATQPVDEVPEWVIALDRPARRRWWPLALAALVAVLLAVVIAPRGPYVGDKGAPAVIVHLLRDGRTTIWDGVDPLGPGDRFRVEVSDLDQPHFAVVYLPPDEPPTVLATGSGDGLAGGAWELDAPARGARLVVVDADRDLSGGSADELLALPVAVELTLR